MNSGTQIERITDTSQQKAARVAGFMFLFSLIVPMLNWAVVLSRLVVADDVDATANNIMANESLYRIGITVELIMSAGLVVLAVALYTILKTVNRKLALLALCWKLVEAGIVAVIVLLSFAALLMADGAPSLAAFTPEQVRMPVGFLLSQHTVQYAVPMVFLGLDLTLFFYLFFRSRYIPRVLAGFGILSYVLILIHALGYLVAPSIASMMVVEVIGYAPSCIAELAIGLWLLGKGIKVSQAAYGSP